MLMLHFDTEYNAHRTHELQRDVRERREREQLLERIRFWKGAALFSFGLLFFVVCFCVAYGW